jgi:hypothetical protein
LLPVLSFDWAPARLFSQSLAPCAPLGAPLHPQFLDFVPDSNDPLVPSPC